MDDDRILYEEVHSVYMLAGKLHHMVIRVRWSLAILIAAVVHLASTQPLKFPSIPRRKLRDESYLYTMGRTGGALCLVREALLVSAPVTLHVII